MQRCRFLVYSPFAFHQHDHKTNPEKKDRIMIASLTGTIEAITESGVVLNVEGIGFEVQTGMDALQILSAKGSSETVHLYTYLNVGREGDLSLYGFLSKEELRLFRMLITVSGIGPKGALSLLSAMSADDLIFAILSGDSKAISRAPGVGKKTADRLVLDLRDKLSKSRTEDLENLLQGGTGGVDGSLTKGGAPGGAASAADSAAADAAEALAALGYTRTDAVKAVKRARAQLKAEGDKAASEDVEQLLKGALRYIS